MHCARIRCLYANLPLVNPLHISQLQGLIKGRLWHILTATIMTSLHAHFHGAVDLHDVVVLLGNDPPGAPIPAERILHRVVALPVHLPERDELEHPPELRQRQLIVDGR